MLLFLLHAHLFNNRVRLPASLSELFQTPVHSRWQPIPGLRTVRSHLWMESAKEEVDQLQPGYFQLPAAFLHRNPDNNMQTDKIRWIKEWVCWRLLLSGCKYWCLFFEVATLTNYSGVLVTNPSRYFMYVKRRGCWCIFIRRPKGFYTLHSHLLRVKRIWFSRRFI